MQVIIRGKTFSHYYPIQEIFHALIHGIFDPINTKHGI